MTTDNHQKLNSGWYSNFGEVFQIWAPIEQSDVSHDHICCHLKNRSIPQKYRTWRTYTIRCHITKQKINRFQAVGMQEIWFKLLILQFCTF